MRIGRGDAHLHLYYLKHDDLSMMTASVSVVGARATSVRTTRHSQVNAGSRPNAALVARSPLLRGAPRCSVKVSAVESLGVDRWNDTYYPTGSDAAAVHKNWYIVDAEGKTLGRVAALVANHIRGKHSPGYTPSMDMGGFVVVVNADKVSVTGRKEEQKIYHRHAVGRPGSWKQETLEQIRQRVPERILEKAVKGMLPKGRLGSRLFTHLKVYKGAEHPHAAQKPVDITALIDAKP